MGIETHWGFTVGSLPHGPRNLISDVPGVTVGHCTLAGGDVQTGVTALLSRAGKELRAGTFSTIYLTSYGGAAIPNFVVGLLPGTHAVLDILSWYVILIAVMYAVMLVLSAKPYPEVQPEELIADA